MTRAPVGGARWRCQSEGAEDGGAVGGDGAAGSRRGASDDRIGGIVGGVRTGKDGVTLGGVSVMAGLDPGPAPAVRATGSGWVAA